MKTTSSTTDQSLWVRIWLLSRKLPTQLQLPGLLSKQLTAQPRVFVLIQSTITHKALTSLRFSHSLRSMKTTINITLPTKFRIEFVQTTAAQAALTHLGGSPLSMVKISIQVVF